ncbi:MAG: flavodoxin domain-containing protein [Actinobacteria bacterium]|nr:flavodoxin domain-containing protein [Actinomycetota bacterium]
MKVLVTAASKHGSTLQIAEAVCEAMRRRGVDARLLPIEKVKSLEGFDAVVLGSAVYAGRWLKAARRMVDEHRAELTERPVWLFSSGPVGKPLEPERSPEFDKMTEATAAREHTLFPGNIDRRVLTVAERAVVSSLQARTGDFRDFNQIRQWAIGVADELRDIERSQIKSLVG